MVNGKAIRKYNLPIRKCFCIIIMPRNINMDKAWTFLNLCHAWTVHKFLKWCIYKTKNETFVNNSHSNFNSLTTPACADTNHNRQKQIYMIHMSKWSWRKINGMTIFSWQYIIEIKTVHSNGWKTSIEAKKTNKTKPKQS